MRALLTAFLLLLSISAHATDYHACKCDTGAEGSCVAGDNGNSGTSSSAPKLTFSASDINSAAAGDRFLFCRGGAWLGYSLTGIANYNATPTSPITFASYSPSWGGTARPIWQISSATNALALYAPFDGTGATYIISDGGYTITGFDFRGTDATGGVSGQVGLFVGRTVRNVLLEDNLFSGFSNALYIGHTSTEFSTFITIKNNTITDNQEISFITGNDVLIEGNTFDNSALDGGGFRHAVYVNCNAQCNRITVRQNTFTDTGISAGECTSGNLTVHGLVDQFLIEGNTIVQPDSTSSCYGISLTTGYGSAESMSRGVVRGNTIVNVDCPICTNSTPSLVVENNVIVMLNAQSSNGITIGAQTPGGGDAADTGAKVRNNTLYLHSSSSAINIAPTGSPTGQVVANNLIQFWGSGTRGCFRHGTLSTYTYFDRNLCFGSSQWSSSYANLAAAQAASFDTNGLNTDPTLVAAPASGNDYACNTQAGSPAINAGSDTYGATRAKDGWVKVSTRDIGACEYGSSP